VIGHRQRILEAQHVSAVRLAPTRRRQNGRPGGERDDREALERAGRLAEELDVDAVRPVRVLVEWKDDHVTRFEKPDDPVERAALADDAEAGFVEAARHQVVEPARLDRPAHEMETPVDLRIALNAGNRRNLPVAEMTGEDQHAFATLERAHERVEVFDSDQRALLRARQPAELEKLDTEPPQMRVMRLREPVDLRRRHRGAEHAPQIVEDDAAPDRQNAKQEAAGEGNGGAGR
jgi:hypothetical protein